MAAAVARSRQGEPLAAAAFKAGFVARGQERRRRSRAMASKPSSDHVRGEPKLFVLVTAKEQPDEDAGAANGRWHWPSEKHW